MGILGYLLRCIDTPLVQELKSKEGGKENQRGVPEHTRSKDEELKTLDNPCISKDRKRMRVTRNSCARSKGITGNHENDGNNRSNTASKGNHTFFIQIIAICTTKSNIICTLNITVIYTQVNTLYTDKYYLFSCPVPRLAPPRFTRSLRVPIRQNSLLCLATPRISQEFNYETLRFTLFSVKYLNKNTLHVIA